MPGPTRREDTGGPYPGPSANFGLERLDLGTAAAVAGIVDQSPRLGDMPARLVLVPLRQREPGIFQMGIALEKPHLGALGDPHCLIQIAPGTCATVGFPEECPACQQTADEKLQWARLTQAVDRLVELHAGLTTFTQRQRRAAKAEVIQGDVKQQMSSVGVLDRVAPPVAHLSRVALGEQQIAITIAGYRG